MTLPEKIKIGDTELQRAYWNCKAEIECREETINKLNSQIEANKIEIEANKIELVKARTMLEKCKKKAAEQGYPSLFD